MAAGSAFPPREHGSSSVPGKIARRRREGFILPRAGPRLHPKTARGPANGPRRVRASRGRTPEPPRTPPFVPGDRGGGQPNFHSLSLVVDDDGLVLSCRIKAERKSNVVRAHQSMRAVLAQQKPVTG